MSATMIKKGPLFTGEMQRAITRELNSGERDVAERGVILVRAQLGRVLKHPTGYYRSRVVATTARGNPAVTDSGVVYGPWLEGVSSRNHSTRFKGYATFRKVREQLADEAAMIVGERIARVTGGR